MRVKQAANLLESKAHDVLVVSHAGMMAYLSVELRRSGYTEPKLRIPERAVLYVYEKQVKIERTSSWAKCPIINKTLD